MAHQRTLFEEDGYLPPIRLFTAAECRTLLEHLRHAPHRPPIDWQKSWAVVSSDFAAVAADDRLLDLVTSLLGDDVILWGASLVVRTPNQVHPWHTDIESASPSGGTVSVWIGLEHTTPLSSLVVVPRSHRFGVTVQQVVQEQGWSGATDEQIGCWARSRDGRSGVVTLGSSDGEAVAFDGRLWHASHNRNSGAARSALLLQYATPDTAIRIPNFSRRQWPFEIYPSPKPACLLVSGRAMSDQNRIVPAPSPVAGRTAVGDQPRTPVDAAARAGSGAWLQAAPDLPRIDPNLRALSCHVSVLDPGRQPHPPHAHADEEILIVLDGEAELVLETPDSPHRVAAGTWACYYPAGFHHTIRNASNAPVTYLMFKWLGILLLKAPTSPIG